jgi:hypothetical protein
MCTRPGLLVEAHSDLYIDSSFLFQISCLTFDVHLPGNRDAKLMYVNDPAILCRVADSGAEKGRLQQLQLDKGWMVENTLQAHPTLAITFGTLTIIVS